MRLNPISIQARDADRWVDASYGQLRSMATSFLRLQRPDHTLEPTALVHEAWLRLSRQSGTEWSSRSQFLAAAAKTMRRILINHAAGRRTLKRGDEASTSELDEAVVGYLAACGDLLVLDSALQRLERVDPRRSLVVELRFFLGLSLEQAAETLGVSARTVERDWSVARAWLRVQVLADSA